MTTANPRGWPRHLCFDYEPGRHRPRDVGGCTFYPYDHVPSRVKSWVVIRGGRYLGLVYRGYEEALTVDGADGRRAFAQTLSETALLLMDWADGMRAAEGSDS